MYFQFNIFGRGKKRGNKGKIDNASTKCTKIILKSCREVRKEKNCMKVNCKERRKND